MATYNYSEISDFEFESLCRDLLQAELGLTLELFAPGPDSGIDIRYVGRPNGERRDLVAQCKRWADGSYRDLLRYLTRVELPKIEALGPSRYILMTSVGLSPARKDEIVNALRPWIHSPSDVFGKDDISGLLARHGEVERRHIKLWLTSTEVLDALLNNDTYIRTEGAIERAKRQLRLWVPNPSLERAREILNSARVCVISGAPGIGKTMLADVLLTVYATRGYEPIVISSDINEGDRLWRSDRRQIFYYDDFLGRVTYGELQLRRNEESLLAQFIERVRNSENKRLILTTREYILSEATHRYQRLGDVTFEDFKAVVSLGDYTEQIRAKILYNHLVFSGLSRELKAALVPDRRYWDVIRHRNYSPRAIEHVVSLADTRDLSPEDFVANILGILDNPNRVWNSIFDNLSIMARQILLALASLPNRVLLRHLRAAVRSVSGSHFDPGEFHSALAMLEGTFVRIERPQTAYQSGDRVVEVRDPSVSDYLWTRLESVDGEAERLLDGSVFFEQCMILYTGRQSSMSPGTQQGYLGGQRSRRPVILDNAMLAEKAFDLIQSDSPKLTNRVGLYPDYSTQEASILERRASFLVGMLNDNNSDHVVTQSAVCALNDCSKAWMVGRGSATGGIQLLRTAVSVADHLSADDVQRAERAFLHFVTNRLEETEKFTVLIHLADLSPRVFVPPNRSINSWRTEFRELVTYQESWLLCDLDDPDWIEQEINALEDVAEAMGENITLLSEQAEERIMELRAEHEYEPDDDEWRGSSVAPRGEGTMSEIDALFQSLL